MPPRFPRVSPMSSSTDLHLHTSLDPISINYHYVQHVQNISIGDGLETETVKATYKHIFIKQSVNNLPETQVALSLASREKSGHEHVKPVISGIHRLLQPPLFCWHGDGFPSQHNTLNITFAEHTSLRCDRNIVSEIDIKIQIQMVY